MRTALASLLAALAAALASLTIAMAADEQGGEVLYCTPATSDFRIAYTADPPPAQSYDGKQTFDASSLINFDTKTEMRTGTQTKQLQCGDIAIEVRGGFYNANPVAELGAADDFAKLSISRRANRVEVSLVSDSCADAFSSRALAAWGDHPVQAIEGRRMGGSYQVTLHKMACEANGKPYMQVLTWPSP